MPDTPPQRQAYRNGAWVDECDLSIAVTDPGFTLGVTVTERLRTFAGAVWRRDEHAERLSRSLEIVGLPTSIAEELDQAVGEFAHRHEPIRAAASRGGIEDDWAIAAFATPGAGDQPTRVVHGFPLAFGSFASQYKTGVALRLSDHRQTPANCWAPELKCRSRMHYYLADQQAQQLEPGARALLLDQEGFVGEASTANVAIYREREGIVTPPLAKVLPGVSLGVLLEIARHRGIPFVERDITPDEFHEADEAWLASTSICLQPVTRLDGRPIGKGTPGPMYERMILAWAEAVGLDPRAQALGRAALEA